MTRSICSLSFKASSTFFFSGTIAPASISAVRGNHHPGAAILDSILNGFRTESAENDGMNRPDPRTSQHRDRSLRTHRHVDDHAIPFFDVVPLENVGELANLAMKLLIGQSHFIPGLTFPDQRSFIPVRPGQMPVQAVLRDI